MPIVSKNGQDFYSIEDDENEMKIAESKGYKPYIEVTKNGQDVFKIEATSDEINTAMSKGYLEKTAFERVQSGKKQPSAVASAAQGAADAMTWGFGDELIGAGTAAIEKGKGLISGKDVDFGEQYTKNRDIIRAQQERLQQANPKSYLGGQIAGAVASPAIAAKGASALGRIGGAAAEGAIQGLGESEDLKSAIDDMVQSGASAATIVTALEGLGLTGKALKAAKKFIPGTSETLPSVNKATAKLSSMTTGGKSTAEDIGELLGNVDVRRSSKGIGSTKDITEQLQDTFGRSDKEIGDLYKGMQKSFYEAPAGDITQQVTSLKSMIDDGRRLEGILGSEAKKSLDTVENIVFKGVSPGELGSETFGKTVGEETIKQRLLKARRNLDDLLFKGKKGKLDLKPEDIEYTQGLRAKINDSLRSLPGGEEFRKADELFSGYSGAKKDFLGQISTKGEIDRTKLSNVLRNQGERGSIFEESAAGLRDTVQNAAKKYGISSKATDEAVAAIEDLRKLASDKRFLDQMQYGLGGPSGVAIKDAIASAGAYATGGLSLLALPITNPTRWTQIVDGVSSLSNSGTKTFLKYKLHKISQFANEMAKKSARVADQD